MDDFKFVLAPSRHELTNEFMLDALRRCSEALGGRPLRTRDFDDWPERPCRAQDIWERFGSWGKALARVGLPLSGRYHAADLVANLEDVWRRLGRQPSANALVKMGRFPRGVYRSRWGNLRRACEAVAAFHAGRITREQLLTGSTSPRRPKVPDDLRWRVFRRDCYRCLACGKCPANDPSVELEIDHIIPISAGGTNEVSNLRTLCGPCNRAKGDQPA